MSRPSASVLSTSTVLPLRMRRMSPGRVAFPPGMFSVTGASATTRTGSLRSRAAARHAKTVAAPIMSYFISPIDAAGFSEIPPLSKVMPFPTRTAVPRAPFGAYSPMRKTGGRALPALTPRRPPIFSRSMAGLSSAWKRSPRRFESAPASRANSRGPRSLPGVLPRSRAQADACATARARSAAPARALASTSGGVTTSTTGSEGSRSAAFPGFALLRVL